MRRRVVLLIVGVLGILGILATASLASNQQENLKLTAPEGAPFPDAFGNANLFVLQEDDHPQFSPTPSVQVELRNVPCQGLHYVPGDLATVSRRFYVLYLTTEADGRMRLMTFNTDCLNGNATFSSNVPSGTDLFTGDVTVEVWGEADDGMDAAAAGVLILTGTADRSD